MRLGVTRNGTVIEYLANQEVDEFVKEFEDLSDRDRFDVYCMYQWLGIRAKRTYAANNEEYEWWWQRVNVIEDLLQKNVLEKEKLQANTMTSYEMLQLGIKMVDRFWRKL